ncbi:MAG: pyridoxal 5'-phosphate synthase [Pseudomonadota bacterium]
MNAKNRFQTLTGDPTLVNPKLDMPPAEPMPLFQHWLEEADRVGVIEPRGFVLSTISWTGWPSSRVLLLKECNDAGIVFTTSERSQKGTELAANPKAAGTLWWRETMQQVSFQGAVHKLSPQRSDEIFRARPRPAQAVAVVSQQTDEIEDEKRMRREVKELLNKAGAIKRPETWHAYQLVVEMVEFWHGSSDRFHKRVRYDLVDGVWGYRRLQP